MRTGRPPVEEPWLRAAIASPAPDECIRWPFGHTTDGYGALKDTKAHQQSFRIYYGPVPDGLEIDHLCSVRDCVNPLHLAAVSHAENVRRAWAGRTHCKNGHEFNAENTRSEVRRNGWRRRVCRTCEKRHQAAYRARRAA